MHETTLLTIGKADHIAPSDAWMERLGEAVAAGRAIRLEVEAGASLGVVATHVYGLLRVIKAAERYAREAPGDTPEVGRDGPLARAVLAMVRLDGRIWRHLVGCSRGSCAVRVAGARLLRGGGCS